MAHPPAADLAMEVRIDPHTLERAEERGTNEEEIREVIGAGFAVSASHGRSGRVKIFEYKQYRLSHYYEQKRVEVIFAVHDMVITTVTVYVFYGSWEVEDAGSL